jgi:hypothetical protein
VADVLVAQQGADVAGQRIGLLRQRRLHVDLHQEVDAAAQVEAEVHRQRVDRRQPARRARQQVQRDDVARVVRIGVERGDQRVLRLALRIEIGEAGLHRVAVVLDEIGLQRRLVEHLPDGSLQRSVDLQRRLAARDLHRRRFAEEIRQRIEDADDERDDEDRVLPDRVAVQARLRRLT